MPRKLRNENESSRKKPARTKMSSVCRKKPSENHDRRCKSRMFFAHLLPHALILRKRLLLYLLTPLLVLLKGLAGVSRFKLPILGVALLRLGSLRSLNSRMRFCLRLKSDRRLDLNFLFLLAQFKLLLDCLVRFPLLNSFVRFKLRRLPSLNSLALARDFKLFVLNLLLPPLFCHFK